MTKVKYSHSEAYFIDFKTVCYFNRENVAVSTGYTILVIWPGLSFFSANGFTSCNKAYVLLTVICKLKQEGAWSADLRSKMILEAQFSHQVTEKPEEYILEIYVKLCLMKLKIKYNNPNESCKKPKFQHRMLGSLH